MLSFASVSHPIRGSLLCVLDTDKLTGMLPTMTRIINIESARTGEIRGPFAPPDITSLRPQRGAIESQRELRGLKKCENRFLDGRLVRPTPSYSDLLRPKKCKNSVAPTCTYLHQVAPTCTKKIMRRRTAKCEPGKPWTAPRFSLTALLVLSAMPARL